MKVFEVSAAAILVACMSSGASAQDQAGARWTSFRNSGTNTAAAESLPVTWSEDSGISWQRELPGYGQSSPLLWDGRLYVTAVKGPMKDESLVLAVDAKTGDAIWERAIETATPAANYSMNSRAAPTPVVDESGLYVFFEGGDVAAFTHDGEKRWHRKLTEEYGEFDNNHGLASSLAQNDDSLFLLADHRGPAYLVSLDKRTGENKWKVARDPRMSWTSPVVATIEGREQVVVSSNGTVDGYDATSGDHLWSVADVGGNTMSSPTVIGSRIYAGASASGRGGGDITRASTAIEVYGGEELSAKIAWRASRASCSYVSPVVVGDYAYHVNDAGVVFCLDAETGETLYRERTAGQCWATPLAAGGHLYLFAKDGQTTVIKTGPEFEQVSLNQLWDPEDPPMPETYVQNPPSSSGEQASSYVSTPTVYGVAAGDGAFFVRTGTRLYRVSD
ncbi:MAG: PQQ-binding-like beta-propeller repeat protein [Planctomycetota bacterium]